MNQTTDKQIEKSLDKEFEKIGAELHTMHVRMSADRIRAVTFVTADKLSYDATHNDIVLAIGEFEWDYMGTMSCAKYVADALLQRGYAGIAVCTINDQFDSRKGRIGAKRRLISNLVHTQQAIA